MLTIVTWLWGDKYSGDDVRKLRAGFRRHLETPNRFVCVTDRAETFDPDIMTAPIWSGDIHLTKIKGCFARLRMFDPEWQEAIAPGCDRIVCCDLDAIVTGPLDPLFDRPEPFVILGGANAVNPCPYNGSLMMLRPGHHANVSRDFTLAAAERVPKHEFPDDQGWLWHMIPNAATWRAGPESGVYAFLKPGWPKGSELPADARMVVFPGWRSPEKFKHLPWVQQHWTV